MGFVTLDSFTHGSEKRFLQWEVELLPQYLELYQARKGDFDQFFTQMETAFQGTLNPTPKYLQAERARPESSVLPESLREGYRPTQLSFATKGMVSYKAEEEARSGVVYLNTESERARFQVFVHQGRVYDSFGRLVGTDGRMMYVMDAHGNVYIHRLGTIGRYQHSSFLAGAPVAAAGSIEIQRGVVQLIDHASGHYQPEAKYLEQFRSRLLELGADLSKAKLDARK